MIFPFQKHDINTTHRVCQFIQNPKFTERAQSLLYSLNRYVNDVYATSIQCTINQPKQTFQLPTITFDYRRNEIKDALNE